MKGWRKVAKAINEVIREKGFNPGDLGFILTNDKNLLDINIEFLNHDYYTDVITFDYSVNKTLNGEIYISVDTVKKNSINYKVSFREESIRVMVHGILHLAGYGDKTDEEKVLMRRTEDEWLERMMIN